MTRIRTGDLARALVSVGFPVATDDMVRGWCEAGKIESWKNPVKNGHYFLQPDSMIDFLKREFQFSNDQMDQICGRLEVKLRQEAK